MNAADQLARGVVHTLPALLIRLHVKLVSFGHFTSAMIAFKVERWDWLPEPTYLRPGALPRMTLRAVRQRGGAGETVIFGVSDAISQRLFVT